MVLSVTISCSINPELSLWSVSNRVFLSMRDEGIAHVSLVSNSEEGHVLAKPTIAKLHSSSFPPLRLTFIPGTLSHETLKHGTRNGPLNGKRHGTS